MHGLTSHEAFRDSLRYRWLDASGAPEKNLVHATTASSSSRAPPPPVRSLRDASFFALSAALASLLHGAVAQEPASPASALAELKTAALADDYFPRVWTVDEGLPSNLVNRIAQDHHGFVWIASGSGLVRLDGYNVKEMPLPQLHSISQSNIRDIAIDSSGGIALVSGAGGLMQLRDGVLAPHPAKTVLAEKNISRLFVEPGGALWIDTADDEVIRWHEGRAEIFPRGDVLPARRGRFHFAIDATGRLWISGGDFLGYYDRGRLIQWPEPVGTNVIIAAAKSGGVWVWASDRLRKWKNGQLRTIAFGHEWTALAQHAVQQLCEDHEGRLWIGTWRKGLFCLSPRGLEAVPTPATSITALLEDRENNLWIGTSTGGACLLRRKSFITLDSGNTQADGVRTSLCEDESGALWWTNRTSGLARYSAGRLDYYGISDGRESSRYMYLVCPDTHGKVWVAASTGLYTIPTESPAQLARVSTLKDVRILVCARNGDVWICSGDRETGYFRAGIYHPCELTPALAQKQVRAIAEDSAGSIWLATAGRELYQWEDGRFVERFAGVHAQGGIVNALVIDGNGSFWMTTTQGLVWRRDHEARCFDTADGLSDEMVSQLVPDDHGRLWFANRRGLCAIAIDDLLAVAKGKNPRVNEAVLDKADGLPRVFAFSGRAPFAWKARDGRLWFSMHQGFAGVDPAQSFPERSAPSVYIDALDIDRKPANPAAAHRLSAGDHHLGFRFSAVSFHAPEKIHLRHQLLGFDADWVETGAERTATYGQLRPGNYRMRVAARHRDGAWSETLAAAPIVIPPAWWQTWTFRILACLALAGGFGALVRHGSHRRLRVRLEKLEREHQLERERARIARDLHDELGYSVTQIGLIADRLRSEDSLTTVRDGLGELTSCTRRLSGELEGVVWTVSPKNNRWDRLASFIRQFALSFFADTPIACTVEGVEQAPDLPLAPEVQHHLLAIVKEALNNTLKHARATRVQLTLAFDARRLSLRIVDNGTGFDPAAPEHSERNGLTNLRERATEIGGELAITSAPGTGTALLLSVPLDAATSAHDPQPDTRR